MGAVNKGQINKIDGVDVVQWMRNRGELQSGFATPAKRAFYDRLYDRRSEDEEEHF